jgi:hypothetical protein
MRERRWASWARGSKGARAHGRSLRTRGRGHVHGGEIVGGRLRTADRWGRRDRERERVGVGEERTAPTALAHGAEREGEIGRAQACGHGRACGLGLFVWLGPKWPFPFSWNFYCLFYLFSLGFSIQIQIKFQIQTESNMCNNSKNI